MISTSINSKLLEISFHAQLPITEGILALVQEWAFERGVSYDDRISLRLVLEELLSNICLHASPVPNQTKIHLSLKYVHAETQKEIQVKIKDNGKEFNPLRQSDIPVESIHDTPLGKRGLSLVRLLASNTNYTRTDGNELFFTISLDEEKNQTAFKAAHTQAEPKKPWPQKLYTLWKGQLAFRQTILFTFYSLILIWGGIGFFYFSTQATLKNNAMQLGMQAMHTQSVISSTFLDRIKNNLYRLETALQDIPTEQLFAHNAQDFTKYLAQTPVSTTISAELPVIGFVAGKKGRTWFFPTTQGRIGTAQAIKDMSPYAVAKNSPIAWKTLPMVFEAEDPHAAMICAIEISHPTSQVKIGENTSLQRQDTWIGVIIAMPWIANTLQKLTGFTNAMPLYFDHTGQYVIFPKGRKLGTGPQSLRDEAKLYNAPELESIEQDMLQGKQGIRQLRAVFSSDKTPWDLWWQGPSSFVYAPMQTPGWFLALVVDSYELGDAPPSFPLSFLIVALLGPLFIGAITWIVTYNTLRPLHALTTSIEKLGKGDTDTPFPQGPYPDEIGNLLSMFERVRVTLRTSFRTLVDNATKQQRLHNELAMARSMQESMLPHSLPQVPGIEIAASIDMAYEVCGDLYSSFVSPQNPSLIYFVVGDVCDKGIPAALIMSRTVSLARSFLMDENSTPAQTLERLNESLLRNDTAAMFVSMLIGVLDAEKGTFLWASAGHPPPIISSPEQGYILPWSKELVLNVRAKQKYTDFLLTLEPEHAILLYTDGADEAMGPPSQQSGQVFGEERLIHSFHTSYLQHTQAESILQNVRQDLQDHMQGRQPADDISLLVIRKHP